MKPLHTGIVFLKTGPVIKYRNISNPKGFWQNMQRKHGTNLSHANMYLKKDKSFVQRFNNN